MYSNQRTFRPSINVFSAKQHRENRDRYIKPRIFSETIKNNGPITN